MKTPILIPKVEINETTCLVSGAIKKTRTLNFKARVSISSISIVEDLFEFYETSLFDPESFFSALEEIFFHFKYEYNSLRALMYVNSIKSLISSVANKMGIKETPYLDRKYYIIEEYDLWYNFIGNLYNELHQIDGLYYLDYDNNKHFVYCFGKEVDDISCPVTEMMSSELSYYWKNQHLIK